MPPLKIGIQLASLRLPLKKALLRAAELGAQGVEIDARGELRPTDLTGTAARQIKKMLSDLSLRVAPLVFAPVAATTQPTTSNDVSKRPRPRCEWPTRSARR